MLASVHAEIVAHLIAFSTGLKGSHSNQKMIYFYFCEFFFPVMNIQIFNYTSRSLSVTAMLIFGFQYIPLNG